jgi:hypothetical protein
MLSNTKKGKDNVIVDALSRRYTMLSQLHFKFFGLENIKEQYLHDAECKDVLQNCRDDRTWNKFILRDGFVFHANKLCIPDGFVCLLLLQEAHGGGLMGHFGRRMYLMHTSFGHACGEMLKDSRHVALLVKKLSLALIHMVYICIFLFLVFLGRIF